RANIPFFECPDAEITTTYYYRWELLTKHLTYGSPNSGYSFTEFSAGPEWPSSSIGHSGPALMGPSVARPGISFTRPAGSASRGSPAIISAIGFARPARSRGDIAPGWPMPPGRF